MTDWQPYREPLRVTLIRTVSIAVIAGGIIALATRSISQWPVISLLLLWPAVGGHWIELFFLNGLRQYLPPSPAIYRVTRVAVWFVGGVLLAAAVQVTARAFFGRAQLLWLTWTIAGTIFVGAELIAHAGLYWRGRPSFFNARG